MIKKSKTATASLPQKQVLLNLLKSRGARGADSTDFPKGFLLASAVVQLRKDNHNVVNTVKVGRAKYILREGGVPTLADVLPDPKAGGDSEAT